MTTTLRPITCLLTAALLAAAPLTARAQAFPSRPHQDRGGVPAGRRGRPHRTRRRAEDGRVDAPAGGRREQARRQRHGRRRVGRQGRAGRPHAAARRTAARWGINPSMYAQMPYDPRKDFAYVGIATEAPYVMVVNPALGAKSVGRAGRGSEGEAARDPLRQLRHRQHAATQHRSVQPAHGHRPAARAVQGRGTSGAGGRGGRGRGRARIRAEHSRLRSRRPAARDRGRCRRAPGAAPRRTDARGGRRAGRSADPDMVRLCGASRDAARSRGRLNAEMKRALAAPDVAAKLNASGLVPVGGARMPWRRPWRATSSRFAATRAIDRTEGGIARQLNAPPAASAARSARKRSASPGRGAARQAGGDVTVGAAGSRPRPRVAANSGPSTFCASRTSVSCGVAARAKRWSAGITRSVFAPSVRSAAGASSARRPSSSSITANAGPIRSSSRTCRPSAVSISGCGSMRPRRASPASPATRPSR